MTQSNATDLPIGTLINGGGANYEIVQVLGTGGFGIAYKARESHLQREVAIKEYFPFDCAVRSGNSVLPMPDPERSKHFEKGLKDFIKEARALASFEHDHIVRIYNNFEANGTAYIVMPYLHGQTLKEFKESRRFSEEEVNDIVNPILSGLKAVHKKGLLHLDIKPENIYLATVDGLPKPRPILIDFGAARRQFGVASQSIDLMLTPGYAPLEQYSKRGNVGPWTDIYALSATLYELFSGDCPPEPDTSGGAGKQHIRPLKNLNNKVSQERSDLIMRGLSARYQDRPQSSDEFLDIWDGHRVPDPPSPSNIPNTRPLWKLWLSAGLLLLASIGLFGGWLPLLFAIIVLVAALLLGLNYFLQNQKIPPSPPPPPPPPPPEEKLLKLFFRTESSGMYAGIGIPLAQELVAGRDGTRVNIVLGQPSISGKHAKFGPIEGRPDWCRVSDLGSRNKTYYSVPTEIGKWQVLEGGNSVELARGSLICLASEQTVVIELR